jgi:flagellar biosynthetic protein FlhB
MPDSGQKTEKATPRRLEKARREGQFSSARELVGAAGFLVFTAMAGWGGAAWISRMRETMRWLFERAFAPSFGPGEMVRVAASVAVRAFLPLAWAGAALVGVALGTQLAVTKMGLSLKKLAPDLQRINPGRKLRDLPRQNLPALLQAVVMIPIFGYAVYVIARDGYVQFFWLPMGTVEGGARLVAATIQRLFWKAGLVFLVFGLVDAVRQKQRYQKDLRMSRHEVREEAKESEGNPQMKQRVRRMQRDLLRRQMMKEVPTATAIIMNPTHYAVALRYHSDSMAAPRVVAKGKNYLALRIRAKALEHQVPVIENPPLAQALYRSAAVGQEIPAHLYRAVAEILAYLYRLMHGRLMGVR